MFGIRRKANSADDLKARFSPARHVVATTEGEERVLLDAKRERYYTLNGVGSRVWELLTVGATVPAIVETVRREYEVPDGEAGDQVEQDVTKLIGELFAAELVTAVPAVPARADRA